jgi:acetoin utilization protein AcuB
MRVRDLMSHPAISVAPEAETKDALQTMYLRKIRRLPVVNARGELLGIVTQRDLFEKSSAAIAVGDVMTPSPYTTTPDELIIRVAPLMRDLDVGALPVVDHGMVVGIITESDIFNALLDLLGARRAGTRLTIPVDDIGHGVAHVLRVLTGLNASVTGLTTVSQNGRPTVIVTFAERDPQDLVRALTNAGLEPKQISVEESEASGRRGGHERVRSAVTPR